MNKEQRYEAERLSLDLMHCMLKRIYTVWNDNAIVIDTPVSEIFRRKIPVSEIFKSAFAIPISLKSDLSTTSQLQNYTSLKSVEKFFGFSCTSSSVDGFYDFFSEHDLDDLHERSSFVTEINRNGRKLVSVSPYLGISEDWKEWIENFVDRIFLDPLNFLVEMDNFEKLSKGYLGWSGDGNVRPKIQADNLREFVKKLLSGEA